MSIAHPCASCGRDLGGLRAPPDPVYGLHVVVCPSCETAAVRRPRALRPRRVVNEYLAGRALTWRMLVLMQSTLIAAGLCVMGGPDLSSGRSDVVIVQAVYLNIVAGGFFMLGYAASHAPWYLAGLASVGWIGLLTGVVALLTWDDVTVPAWDGVAWAGGAAVLGAVGGVVTSRVTWRGRYRRLVKRARRQRGTERGDRA